MMNVEEIFWTNLKCHIKEHAWTLQENNTIRRCWIIYLTIMIVRTHHCPVKISKKQLAESWQKRKKKKNMLNVTSIMLLWILGLRPT